MKLFFVAALLLLVSFVLIQNTSVISHHGGSRHEWRQMRALLAKILFVASLLMLSVALVAACCEP